MSSSLRAAASVRWAKVTSASAPSIRGRMRRKSHVASRRSAGDMDAPPAMSCPVGVYDSGYGGLTVLRQLRRTLPELDYLYLGDSGRAPYGGRDVDTILDFAEQCVERLFAEGCRVIV